MASKEKLVSIHVHTPFKLTLADHSVVEFKKGRHNVSETVAAHWFTQAHSEQSGEAVSVTGDQQELIDTPQAQIAEKDKLITDKDTLIADLKDALLKLQEQNDTLQAQIAAAGNGVKDGKKS